jgi:hypothetical protein
MKYSTGAAALLLAAMTATGSASAQVPTVSKGDVAKPDKVDAMKLRLAMRDLWADHVIWTREYIANAIEADATVDAASKRLMKNQEDIGNAIVPYYGAEAGAKLTTLLKEHITIAGELVTAAKASDNAKVTSTDQRWRANAREIATFLSSANPNWSMNDLNTMLNEHLTITALEAKLRLEKKWAEDVENFDKIYDQAMHMADALTDGIVKQFNK